MIENLKTQLSLYQEQLSFACVQAIASSIGCTFHVMKPDQDSTDAQIRASKNFFPGTIWPKPILDIQIKSTTNWEPLREDDFSFHLKIKNYNDLCAKSAIPQILIVYRLPRDPKQWVEANEDFLLLRHSAYWHNLMGCPRMPDFGNAATKSLRISRRNLLSGPSLLALMRKAARREELGDVL